MNADWSGEKIIEHLRYPSLNLEMLASSTSVRAQNASSTYDLKSIVMFVDRFGMAPRSSACLKSVLPACVPSVVVRLFNV